MENKDKLSLSRFSALDLTAIYVDQVRLAELKIVEPVWSDLY